MTNQPSIAPIAIGDGYDAHLELPDKGDFQEGKRWFHFLLRVKVGQSAASWEGKH